MLKRFGKRKSQKIASTVVDLISSAVRDPSYDITGINHADYSNAFGIVQGVSYVLGYASAGITNREDQPGFWLSVIIEEANRVYSLDKN